jgi:hypothetical protein
MTKRGPMIEPSVFSTMTLALLAVAALSGCGREDATGSAAGLTAPGLATQGGYQYADESDGSAGSGDPSAEWVPINEETPAPDAAHGVSVVVNGQVSEITVVVPRHGGTYSAGRHTLKITPNTFKTDVQITLRDLSNVTGRVECELLFDADNKKSMQLTSNFSDVMPVDGCLMFELVDVAGATTWLPAGGSLTDDGVRAHVSHPGRFAPSPTS